MPSVSMVSIDDLIEKAMQEAPVEMPELSKTASVKNSFTVVADKLDKLASELEAQKSVDLSQFKHGQSEKRAALTQIVKTYLELESSK